MTTGIDRVRGVLHATTSDWGWTFSLRSIAVFGSALAMSYACGPSAPAQRAQPSAAETPTRADAQPMPPEAALNSFKVDAPADSAAQPGSSTLFQAGTFSALLAADYRGNWSFGEIKPRGNFGLGTFEGINGELIVADGGYWQVHPDGHVTEVKDSQRTPYVEVIHFQPEIPLVSWTPNNAQ